MCHGDLVAEFYILEQKKNEQVGALEEVDI